MEIPGYAFDPNREEVIERYRKRFEEIKHLGKTLVISKDPAYGEVRFSGVLNTDEEKQLDELDIALLADNGNLCFGGHCTRTGDRFSGSYSTD